MQVRDLEPQQQKMLFITLGLILFIGLILIFGVSGGSSEPVVSETEQSEVVEEPKVEEQKEYDLDIVSGIDGLTITNKEDLLLTGCQIEVNSGTFGSGYKGKVNIPANDSSIIMWGNITKDGERFNFFEMKPERISVSQCNNDSRFSYYEFSS